MVAVRTRFVFDARTISTVMIFIRTFVFGDTYSIAAIMIAR